MVEQIRGKLGENMTVKIFQISTQDLIREVSCLLCYEDFTDLCNNVNCRPKNTTQTEFELMTIYTQALHISS